MNLKRRKDADIQMRVREGTRSIIMSMIATLDNIDRAMNEARKDQEIKEVANVISGLEFIRKGMFDQLALKGVTSIYPMGLPFDPNQHEALGSKEDRSVPNNTILEVMEIGFLYDGQVLRPAKVMVSKGGSKQKIEPVVEMEEFELEDTIEEEEDKVLELEPWRPKLEVLEEVDDDDDDSFVVAKPRKK
jgi:molecular chaperone GrpE